MNNADSIHVNDPSRGLSGTPSPHTNHQTHLSLPSGFCALYLVCCTSTALISHFSSHLLKIVLVMPVCTPDRGFPEPWAASCFLQVNHSLVDWSPEEGRGLREHGGEGCRCPHPGLADTRCAPRGGGPSAKCCLGHGCLGIITLVSMSM